MDTERSPDQNPTTDRLAPSGLQFEISFEDQRATIVEVGGGIRTYTSRTRDILQPYPLGAMCDGAHGAPLIPWPNRLADGRYTFDGVEHQLALTEPDRHNAIHGLLRWRPWQLHQHDRSTVTVGARLLPMQGYPFALDLRVTYELGPEGLTVSTTASNLGDTICPYGAGQHPYLSPGSGVIDDCTLQLGASTRVLTDEHRQLPTGVEAVQGTAYDFTTPRRIGALGIDHGFTDLIRDPRGRSWVGLTGPDGSTARIWVDEHHHLIQVFTGDALAADRARRGLGAEPMTCPPDAFNSGESLIRLEPGDSITTTWGADLVGAP